VKRGEIEGRRQLVQSKKIAQRRPCHAVILCHPSLHSFNAAAAHAYCRTVRKLGQRAVLRDLYRLEFDPVLRDEERPGGERRAIFADVARELRAIRSADVLVLIYPVWFGSPPAMMKGYIERVLGSQFGHQLVQAGAAHPWLSGKALLSITSSGTPIQWLELKGARAALRTLFDDYIAQAFSMCSAEHLHISGIVDGLDSQLFDRQIARVVEQAESVCHDRTFSQKQ
jgi:NAD(P)H dehydrogenase (quinone)